MNESLWRPGGLVSLLGKRIPGQLVIQLTDRCNASCPQCGMRVSQAFARTRLRRDDVKRILDAAAMNGVRVVSFTGGEPLLLLNDLVDLIQYAGRAGIDYIRTGTNGFFLRRPESAAFESRVRAVAEKLAATPLRNFWISIDSSLPSVHEGMRGLPGVIRGIEKALPLFHECGIYPSANLGINRNLSRETMADAEKEAGCYAGSSPQEFYKAYRTGFRRFYRFVEELGFTMVNSCYPMSVGEEEEDGPLAAIYGAASSERLVGFTPGEKAVLFQALLHAVSESRHRIRIFSPRSSLYSLARQYGGEAGFPYPCRGGIDFFFIDCRDGDTYPCGYRGRENLGKYWDLDGTSRPRVAECRACDWECFRDPSELFGPILQGLSHPLALGGRILKEPAFFKLWVADILYARACDFFNGRRPPHYSRLGRFQQGDMGHEEDLHLGHQCTVA
ncbi:MAG: radical SAM protein [Deltaproteobacteria bacterium]|nr:radical SAM protein [Deltaproteobacteria bacterium]